MYILRRRFDVRFLVQMTFFVNSKCNLINVILIFVIFVIFYLLNRKNRTTYYVGRESTSSIVASTLSAVIVFHSVVSCALPAVVVFHSVASDTLSAVTILARNEEAFCRPSECFLDLDIQTQKSIQNIQNQLSILSIRRLARAYIFI